MSSSIMFRKSFVTIVLAGAFCLSGAVQADAAPYASAPAMSLDQPIAYGYGPGMVMPPHAQPYPAMPARPDMRPMPPMMRSTPPAQMPWSREGQGMDRPEMSEEMQRLMAERQAYMEALTAEREQRIQEILQERANRQARAEAERQAYMEQMEAMRAARMQAVGAGVEAYRAEMEKQRAALMEMVDAKRNESGAQVAPAASDTQ